MKWPFSACIPPKRAGKAVVVLPFDRAESPQSADLQAAVKDEGTQRESPENI